MTKAYGTGAAKAQVLRGVSFDIDKGELIALVGQSGSGKSTLLNIIGGLDKPDAGEVEVMGIDTLKASDRTLAELRNRKMGFVFQAFNLLDHLNVLQNVTLPASFSHHTKHDEVDDRGREALRKVGLSDFAHRKPGELSGGQKQRVAIARALFGSPELLLCDEPTGNLDSDTGREVIDFFRELNAKDGVTLLIVSHYKLADLERAEVLLLEEQIGVRARVRDERLFARQRLVEHAIVAGVEPAHHPAERHKRLVVRHDR
ncbi:MAG TPA: ABC transporter ATP-binding protein, partial [Kofleriaceae bacterium]